MRFSASMLFAALLICASLNAGQKKPEPSRDILLEKDLMGVSVGTVVGGPHVSSEDLAGRVVLFVFSGPGDEKWNDFLSRMVNQYAQAAPPGGLLTIFAMDNKNSRDNKWWLDAKGHPSVTFVKGEEFAMPGFFFYGLPRFILFDSDGKMVGDICHDGRDMSGNSVHTYAGERFTPDSIRKLIETGSGAVLKSSQFKECADDAQRLVIAVSTSAPLTPLLSALRNKASGGKGSSKSEAAQILAEFREYLAKQVQTIERNIATHPSLAMRTLKRNIAQLAGDKELAVPFERLQKQLKENTKFQEDLRAAEMLNSVRNLAATIAWGLKDPDYPQRPKEKIVNIKKGLQDIISQFPRTPSAQTAEELQAAYGRWVARAINPQPW